MNHPARVFVFLSCLVSSLPAFAATAPQSSLVSRKAAESLLLDVAEAGNRLVAVGERGHVVVSDDRGQSWRQVAVPTRVMLSAVYFPTAKHGYAVGHDSTIIATRDGGETWALQYFREFDPDADMAGDADAVDEDADYLDEEGAGRESVNREGVPLLDVWFADEEHGLAVGAYGLLLATADGGRTWEDGSNRVPNRDGWHLNAIAGIPGASATVFLAGEKGTLYRSTDGGRTFSALASPAEGSFFGLLATPGRTLYAFGLQGVVLRSTNLGQRWDALSSGVTSGLNDGCIAPDGSIVIAGNAGVVLHAASDSAPLAGMARPDRQAVLSCARAGTGLVLVGEGGARRSTVTGKSP